MKEWVINTFKDFTSHASLTMSYKKNSYTNYKWGQAGSIKISSSSIPNSDGAPLFFNTGKGLKIFFSIISITRSKWGIMRDTTVLYSFNKSLSSYK